MRVNFLLSRNHSLTSMKSLCARDLSLATVQWFCEVLRSAQLKRCRASSGLVQSLRFSSDCCPPAPTGCAGVLSAGGIALPGVVLHQTKGFPLFNCSGCLWQVLMQSNVLIISPSLDFLFENNIFSYWIMHHSAVECSLLCLIFLPPPGLTYILFYSYIFAVFIHSSFLHWIISLKADLISHLQSCL